MSQATKLRCMDSTMTPTTASASTDNTAPKIYNDLNDGQDIHDQRREIRVLTLSPSRNKEEQIVCTLKKVALKEHTSYTTLSYTWGDAKNPREILVKGHPFPTTINLHKALTQFRDAENSIDLWVDAICIDQKNSRERDSQVKLMREIFSHAERTWLWLGEEANQSAKAIKLINHLSEIYLKSRKEWDPSPESIDKSLWGSLKDHSTTEELVALNDLLARDYWYRIWVVQEIAVSSEIVVFCGKEKTTWDAILFTAYILDYQVEYRELIQEYRPVNIYPRGIQTGIQRIMSIQSVRNDFKKAKHDTERDSLLFLLSNHRFTEATEPKDKYIALAGLLEGQHQEGLRFYDEHVSLKDVYIFAVLNLAYQSIAIPHIKPLDFLDCAGKDPKNDDWPSWVPDWRTAAGRATPLLYWQLAAKLDEDVALLEAAGKTNASSEPRFSFEQVFPSGQLRAEGFNFDAIIGVSFSLSTNPIANLETKPRLYPTYERLPDVLWRACVLDRSHTGDRKAPSDWANIFYQYLASEADNSNTLSLLGQWFHENKDFRLCGRKLEEIVQEHSALTVQMTYSETILMQFKTAFMNAVGHRKLATTSRGYLCLAPQIAEVGDTIAILIDCNVPVMLRSRGSEYVFLGTCYVHGAMRGEGIIGRKAETFSIH